MEQKPARWVDNDGIVHYRASSLGMCDRVFVAIAEGMTPHAFPEWFQEVLDEGTRMEDEIVARFNAEHDTEVFDSQRKVTLEIMDGVVIDGHIDGLVPPEVDSEFQIPSLMDAKKFRDSTWSKWLRNGVECNANYPMQMSIYMHALSDEYDGDVGLFMVGGHYWADELKGEEGISEIHTHAYIDPMVNRLAIRKRVGYLEKLINDGASVTDVACPATPMYPCPFFYLHDTDAVEPPARPADADVGLLLTGIVEMQEKKKALDKEVRELDKSIKALKGGLEGWAEAAGKEDGETSRLEVEGVEYDVKILTVERKGYTVEDGEYVKVDVKLVDGGVKKRAVKKAAAKKVPAAAAKKVPVKKIAARKK